MINKSLFKIYGNISYSTLSKIPIVTGVSYGGLVGTSLYISRDNPSIGMGLNLASSIAVYASYLCHKTNGKIYCKEIKELRKLYDIVLENYQLVNEIFELNNPVEIYTMFNEALKHGYLSVDKYFLYDETKIKNLETLYPIVPITGTAVCRHIAPMLRDILKKSGIESNVLIVKPEKPSQEKIKKEVIDKIEKKGLQEKIINIYTRIEENNASQSNIQESSPKVFHAVTLAEHKNKIHFLDSTQERIYKLNQNDKNIITDESLDDMEIRIDPSVFIGTKKDLQNQKRQIEMLNTDYEEDLEYVKLTERKFKNNRDVLEKLYSNSKEVYEEINQKILRFKGR